MVITDPIADMLTRIRNAYTAKHDEVSVPASTIKKAIAEILLDEGYIKGYEIKEEGPKKTMNIALKYGPNRQRVITGLKRISKPGLRVYARKDNVPKVLNGMGIAILSTSHGVMTDRGIIDPTKVTRSALQNAASIAAMVLTTESLVCDIPAPEPAAPAPGAGGMGGMY